MQILAGNSDFKSVRQHGYYYVDKSMLAAEVMTAEAQVMWITRPRRFGKTLNLSMLEAFFQLEGDNRALFKGLAIENDPEAMAHQGAYPTLFLTFKDFNITNWEDCEYRLRALFSTLFLKNKLWIDRAKPQYSEHDEVEQILRKEGPLEIYRRALKLLTDLLYRATGSHVMILIDEYDTPINAGQMNGFFDPIVTFMRSLLGVALKDNTSLKRGVLTGILRVAKESIFSGLNNIQSYSLLSETFANRFGFTTAEMEQVLADFNLSDRKDDATAWYNGYNIGRHLIYNPWSIINLVTSRGKLANHWINTSSNDLIKQLLLWDRSLAGGDLAQLLQGKSIKRKLSDSITLRDIQPKDVWSLMFYSGYLTTVDQVSSEEGVYALRIPNLEVRSFFEDTVTRWLGPAEHWDVILDALLREDMAGFEKHLSHYVLKTISYHDLSGPAAGQGKHRTNTTEALYHMLFLGMLMSKQAHYEISSNRESGEGRYDVVLLPKNHQEAAYIFEFKRTTPRDLETAAGRALQQIKDRQYSTALVLPPDVKRLIFVGIAFSGKRLAVAHQINTPGGEPLSKAPLLVTGDGNSVRQQSEENPIRELVRVKVAKILENPIMARLLETDFRNVNSILEKGIVETIGTIARALVHGDEPMPTWHMAQNLIGWLLLNSLEKPLPQPWDTIVKLPIETHLGAEIAIACHERRAASFCQHNGILSGENTFSLAESYQEPEELLRKALDKLSVSMNLSVRHHSLAKSSEIINSALDFANITGRSWYLAVPDDPSFTQHITMLNNNLPGLKIVILKKSPEALKLIPQEHILEGVMNHFMKLSRAQ